MRPCITDPAQGLSMFGRTMPTPLEKSPPNPPESGIERGRYLLTLASCADCHTTANEKREPIPGHYLAGGNRFPITGKGYVVVPNITSDKATGIGSYTDEDILRALNEGIGKNGRPLYGMPWPYYKGMTDADKKALVVALREVPPVVHAVPPSRLKL